MSYRQGFPGDCVYITQFKLHCPRLFCFEWSLPAELLHLLIGCLEVWTSDHCHLPSALAEVLGNIQVSCHCATEPDESLSSASSPGISPTQEGWRTTVVCHASSLGIS